MDVTSKIWNFSGTGTKIHAYINGRSAACRSSIARPAGSDMDYCQVKQDFKSSVCTACEAKFNAAIERAEDAMRPATGEGDHLPPAQVVAEAATAAGTHPAAGTYYPAAAVGATPRDARPLVLQGQHISATVYADGSYTVFAGVMVIVTGQLEGAETNLMGLFADVARIWALGIDVDRKAHAEAQQAKAEQHMAAQLPPKQTMDEIVAMVQALGGEYRSEDSDLSVNVRYQQVVRALGNAERRGVNVDVVDVPNSSRWYIEMNDGAGRVYIRYHFLSR